MVLHGLHLLSLLVYISRCASGTPTPPNCNFLETGPTLECSHNTRFPNGHFKEVQTINFLDNNITQLSAYVFFDHSFLNLKKAILRSNHIRKILPKAFSSMSSVLHLDLYGNELSKLTKSTFTGLTTLKTLNLGGNRIVSITAEVLEPLTYLDALDLSRNLITELPVDLLEHGSVTQLDVSENPVVFSERGPILESPFLIQLLMKSCNLEQVPREAFSELVDLQILDLSRNKLKVIPEGSLKELTKLRYLDISNNFISHLEERPLSPVTKLKQFSCDGNIFPAEMCKSFLDLASVISNRNEETTLRPVPKKHPTSLSATEVVEATTGDVDVSTYDAEDTLMILIAIVTSICVILIVIIVFLSYYLKWLDAPFSDHIYAEVQYSDTGPSLGKKLPCVQV